MKILFSLNHQKGPQESEMPHVNTVQSKLRKSGSGIHKRCMHKLKEAIDLRKHNSSTNHQISTYSECMSLSRNQSTFSRIDGVQALFKEVNVKGSSIDTHLGSGISFKLSST